MGTKRPVKRGILDSLGREIGYKQPEASAVEFDPVEYLSGMNDIYAEEKLADESQADDDFFMRPDSEEVEEAKDTLRRLREISHSDTPLSDEEKREYAAASREFYKSIQDDLEGVVNHLPDADLTITGAGSLDSQEAVSQLWGAYQEFKLPERLLDKAQVDWDANRLISDIANSSTDRIVDGPSGARSEAAKIAKQFKYDDDGFKESFQQLLRYTQAVLPVHSPKPYGIPDKSYSSLKIIASEMDYHGGIHKKHTDEFNELNGEFDRLLSSDDGQPTEEMAAQIYEAAQKAIPAHTAYLTAKDKLDNYVDGATEYAGAVSARAESTRFFKFMDTESFGTLHSMSGPGASEKHGGDLGIDGFNTEEMSVLFSKAGQLKDEQLEKMWQVRVNGDTATPGEKTYTDAEIREARWEGALGVMFSANNPEFMGKLMRGGTYQTADGKAQMTFDYLVTDGTDKPPSGIVEVATSEFPDKWGSSGGGIDDIDQKYRAKLLGQMLESGVDTGYVAVMINGHDYRDYKVTMTDELRAEAMENRRKANLIYDVMRQARDLPAEERQRAPLAELKALAGHTVRSAPGDFPAAALTPGSNNQAKQAIFNHVAAATGESAAEVKQRFEEIMGPVESYQPPRGASAEEKRAAQEKVKDGLRQLYRDIDFTERPVAALSITATSTSPTKARILDLGLSVRDLKSDTPMNGFSTTFKIPYGNRTAPGVEKKIRDSFEPWNATSIQPATFNNRQEGLSSRLLRTYRKDAEDRSSEQVRPIIVSPKASLDRNLLRAQLKGFAEAEARGEVRIFDTTLLSRRDPEARKAVSEFVLNSHRKNIDPNIVARETLNALKAYNDRFHGNG